MHQTRKLLPTPLQAPEITIPYALACRSSAGARPANEDLALASQLHVQSLPCLQVLAVADGMGGGPCGALAAQEALLGWLHGLIAGMLAPTAPGTPVDLPAVLHHGFDTAWQAVRRAVAENPFLEGMASVLATAVATGDKLIAMGVGDCRVYLVRRGQVLLLTKDDSLVQLLVDARELTPEEAQNHPRDNEITEALGWEEGFAKPDYAIRSLLPGDLVLVSSDGFWKTGEAELPDLVRAHLTDDAGDAVLENFCEALVQTALENGADDNISVAALWRRPAAPEPSPTPEKGA